MKDVGVILYPEQQEFTDLLSLEQKGMLLDALFAIAHGEEPVIDDGMVAMAVVYFKQRHRQNQEKFEAISKARSEAGKKGAENKQKQANVSKNKQTQANASKTSNYNNNYNYNNNTHSNTDVLSCVKDAHADTREEYAKELIQDENFAERTAMNFHVAAEDILILVNSFNNEQAVKSVAHVDYNDYRRHAYDWIRIQIEKKEKERKHGNPIDNIREAQERQIARLNKIAARDGGVLETVPEPF